ncbi:SAF domain-containing protein [Ornithinimicrobium cerasi]|nr:SAF domain-containing protein [Ornithinimicrobium cerasi]
MPTPTLTSRAGTARGAGAPEAARPARRLEPPSWKDLRLVVGVLLVLLSVAGGIRLVASLDDTTPVYVAARDLLPGQPVREGDLVPVQVRLGDAAARYVDGTAPITTGTHLLRPVATGELVPSAALGTARQALDKTVSVPVDTVAARSLVQGAVVDVWVSRRDPDAVGEAYVDPELLLGGAVLDRVPAESSGLGAGLGRTAVQVVVPADRVGDVIAAVDQGARVTLVPAPRAVPQEGGR